MKIIGMRLGRVAVPLKKPFVTALRTVLIAEDVVIKLETESKLIGYGSATATVAITGETLESIEKTIAEAIAPHVIGKNLEDLISILADIDNCIAKNTSAKACVVTALYDLVAQSKKMPLYKFFGGSRNQLETDLTISMKQPVDMVADALEGAASGFDTLKIKVGSNYLLDFERVNAIRHAVGKNIKIRVDANQGWTYTDAIEVIRQMEKENLGIEFVEQPVKAFDLEGLKKVSTAVSTPIAADESMFSPVDAEEIITNKRAQILNIKLAKAGGFHRALQICELANRGGLSCMISSMLETSVGINAAAALAASQDVFKYFDLDAGLLQKENPVVGGALFEGKRIQLSEEPGLGIHDVKGWTETQFIST